MFIKRMTGNNQLIDTLYNKLGGKYSKKVIDHYVIRQFSQGRTEQDILNIDVKRLSQSVSQFKRHNGGEMSVDDLMCYVSCSDLGVEQLEQLEEFLGSLIDAELNLEELEKQQEEIERRKNRAIRRHRRID